MIHYMFNRKGLFLHHRLLICCWWHKTMVWRIFLAYSNNLIIFQPPEDFIISKPKKRVLSGKPYSGYDNSSITIASLTGIGRCIHKLISFKSKWLSVPAEFKYFHNLPLKLEKSDNFLDVGGIVALIKNTKDTNKCVLILKPKSWLASSNLQVHEQNVRCYNFSHVRFNISLIFRNSFSPVRMKKFHVTMLIKINWPNMTEILFKLKWGGGGGDFW